MSGSGHDAECPRGNSGLLAEHHRGQTNENEQELSELAMLHIVTLELGSSLNLPALLCRIEELIEQLVGVAQFVLYVLDEGLENACPVLYRQSSSAPPLVQVIAGSDLQAAVQSGCISLRGHDPRMQVGPLAVVPLMSGRDVVAVLRVDAFHPHKGDWTAGDAKLLKVVSVVGGITLASCVTRTETAGARSLIWGLATTIGAGAAAQAAAPEHVSEEQ